MAFGVRPESPVLYRIAATGTASLTYSITSLPKGLSVDSRSGVLSGHLSQTGERALTVKVENAAGAATRVLQVEVGDQLALTPPMGWNSWYC